MQNLLDLPVREFPLSGVILDDSDMWRLKKEYAVLLGIQMRNSGYVPRLDKTPQFRLEYNSRNHSYSFLLVAYGVYVGERECEWMYGVDEEGPIPIPQSRSSESCSEAV